jgi:hypothetical protein
MFYNDNGIKDIKDLFIYADKFIKAVKKDMYGRYSPFGFFYRGQPKYNDELIPSIFREDNKIIADREPDIFREFQLIKNTQDNFIKTNFEWLIMMQHYGLPTRLLDWTKDILIALYFSVRDKKYNNDDGALFILEPISLNNVVYGQRSMCDRTNSQVIIHANLSCVYNIDDLKKTEEIKKLIMKGESIEKWLQREIEMPIAVIPPIQNDRIFLQKGVFTLHGGKKSCIASNEPKKIEDLARNNDGTHLAKIKIHSDAKNAIKEELDFYGINESTIFPELEYQSNYIKERWSKNAYCDKQ